MYEKSSKIFLSRITWPENFNHYGKSSQFFSEEPLGHKNLNIQSCLFAIKIINPKGRIGHE
jgi:hypothetical protein